MNQIADASWLSVFIMGLVSVLMLWMGYKSYQKEISRKRNMHIEDFTELRSSLKVVGSLMLVGWGMLICSLIMCTIKLVQPAHAAPLRHFDIVFDLDDTLIRWIRPDEKIPAELLPISGTLNGYRYRILDGAPEILEYAVKLAPIGARVSFYSLGPLTRNVEVLRLLKLPDGRSAYDVAYKILSGHDAVPVDGVLLKDLRLVNSDLERVFLVDDRFVTTLPGQELNVVHILPKPGHFFSTVDESWRRGENERLATSPRSYFQNRNKLALAVSIIDRALTEKVLTPFEALTAIQYQRDTSGMLHYREELVDDIRFYREGARIFHQMDSKYSFTSVFGKQTPEMARRKCELLLLAE